jgi:fibronectin-binding autotransporter adhesin
MKPRLARLASSSSFITLQAALFAAYAFQSSTALAECATNENATICSGTNSGTIGTGPLDNNRRVTLENGATLTAGDTNAISLGDNAQILIRQGSTVSNDTRLSSTGLSRAGPNTIEFGSNGQLVIERGASVVQNGTSANSEPINVMGFGNSIINYGDIISNNNAAVWFEDRRQGARNSIDNYGTIRRIGGGNVIGSNGGSGIDFINRTGALVEGKGMRMKSWTTKEVVHVFLRRQTSSG